MIPPTSAKAARWARTHAPAAEANPRLSLTYDTARVANYSITELPRKGDLAP